MISDHNSSSAPVTSRNVSPGNLEHGVCRQLAKHLVTAMIDIITLSTPQDVTIVTLVTRLPHDYWPLFGSMLIEFKQTLPEVVIH